MNGPDANRALRHLARLRWFSASELQLALRAPVFALEPGKKFTADELEFAQEHAMDFARQEVKLAPFPWIRIRLAGVESIFDVSGRFIRHWNLFPNGTQIYVADLPGPDTNLPARMEFAVCEHGREVSQNDIAAFVAAQRKAGWWPEAPRACRHYLFYTLAQLTLPGSVVLRIRPQHKPGKTEEWVKAREHIVIVPKRTATQLQTQKSGITRHQESRAAHWRRAHLRRLQSPMFTHLRGRFVPVRSAWVGPVEWTGSDKKLYRVLAVDGKAMEPSA